MTTARLYVTDSVLEESDLRTGKLGALAVRQVDAVWFDAHVNRSLLPSKGVIRPGNDGGDPIGHDLKHEHRRAVMVANVEGLSRALESLAFVPLNELR